MPEFLAQGFADPVLGAGVACALGCHADNLAVDKLVALPLGLLHRPGDELIGGHAGRLGRAHAGTMVIGPPPRKMEKSARKGFRRCGISRMVGPC